MMPPLALTGKGLHSVGTMRFVLIFILGTCLTAPAALAQTAPEREDSPPVTVRPPQPRIDDGVPDLPPPEFLPDVDPDAPRPEDDGPEAPPVAPTPDIETPDYSRLSSNAERAIRLEGLFKRLAYAETEERGQLIAEEIYALWLDSGSPSVNLVLRRGGRAHTAKNLEMARVMFDHVTTLEPEFAEGWARSARLALEEGDYERAISESVTALSLEPRHFYALWTLGNVLDRLGRTEEALKTYQEAARIHPKLTEVTDRVAQLESQLGGSVL